MMDSIPQQSTQHQEIPHSPQGHPQLFVLRNPSSAKKLISPSKNATRLAGVYPPTQIYNPSTELNNAISRAVQESEESLNARLDAMFPEIEAAFASVVELVMWHDKPTKKTFVKRSFLRRRVASQLALPFDCFDRGPWAKKSKKIIEQEMVS
jgi:hypothetical protein